MIKFIFYIFGSLLSLGILNAQSTTPVLKESLCPFNATDGTVKNTTSGIDCGYPSTTWDCPKGFFCQTPQRQSECRPGFFCPLNSFQPIYCPAGFYCSSDASSMAICPRNFYCPIGTIKPYKCSYLAICPEGTQDAPKVVVFVVMLVLLLIPVFFFKWKDASNRIRRLRHKYEVDSINSHSSTSLIDQQALTKLSNTFDIEFQNLSLKLPNGVTIMSGVSGMLRSGRTTAIMGPSGAGKTTFITLLTGKTKRTTGTVLINGEPDELLNYKKLIGYVPQDDIMLRELTVRDILMHSARMRLPADWNYSKIKMKMLEIISFLGMSHVIDSIVGNEEERGISGGQRKRVNIGMELVAEPSVLFLDEPTSGLDSSTSFDVCAKLREIARQQGLTIAAVIHSPSPATFREFDDFLLLGKGGKVVYMGPRELAAQYFAGIGFECPPDESESDFFMDVVSGRKKSSLDPYFKLTDLFHYWELTATGKPISFINRAQENAQEVITPPVKKLPWYLSFLITLKTSIMGTFHFWWDVLMDYGQFLLHLGRALVCIPDPVRNSTPMYRQLWLLMKRSSKQVFRNARVIIFDVLLHFGCGVFISIATQNFTYLGQFPGEVCETQTWSLRWVCYNPTDNIKMAGMFVCLGVFFAGIAAGSSTFGREKVVFWRDTAAGMSAIPYYVGKFLVDFPRVLVAGGAFSAALVLFYPLKGPFVNLLLLVELLYFNAFAMGYFLSIIFAPAKTPLIGTGFALFWSLCLSGVLPELKEVRKAPLNSFAFLWDISAPRWGIEYFWIMEVNGTAFGGDVEIYWQNLVKNNETQNFRNGFAWTNQSTDLRNIVLLTILWNLISFFSLKLTNREKQK